MPRSVSISEEYAVVPAEPEDVLAIIDVHLASNRLFAGTGLLPESELANHMPSDAIRQAMEQKLVFRIGDDRRRVVGFAATRVIGQALYLDQVSVLPEAGRRGLGRRLVLEVIEASRERGLKSVLLSTFRDLAWNGPFYRQLGFREVPRKRITPWMQELEAAQATTMDVSLRCFMERKTGRKLFQTRSAD